MRLVALDPQLLQQTHPSRALPVIRSPWAIKLWCELLISGVRGALRLVVLPGQADAVRKSIQRLCHALEQSGLELRDDTHWRRANMRRSQPEFTDRICELASSAPGIPKHVVTIGCPLDSDEDRWCHALQELAHLIAEGFDDLQLTDDQRFRLKQLEQPFAAIGGSARRVVLIDRYAWTACVPDSVGGRAEARDSLKWLLATLFSGKRDAAALGLVTAAAVVENRVVNPADIVTGFESHVSALDPSGHRVSSAWVLIHSRKRRRDDRLHARFIATDFGAWVVDPGIDQLVTSRSGELSVPDRSLVRVARREDETLIRRLTEPQRGLDEQKLVIRPQE